MVLRLPPCLLLSRYTIQEEQYTVRLMFYKKSR